MHFEASFSSKQSIIGCSMMAQAFTKTPLMRVRHQTRLRRDHPNWKLHSTGWVLLLGKYWNDCRFVGTKEVDPTAALGSLIRRGHTYDWLEWGDWPKSYIVHLCVMGTWLLNKVMGMWSGFLGNIYVFAKSPPHSVFPFCVKKKKNLHKTTVKVFKRKL